MNNTFFSFVDDYSRVTWMHLLKSRSEVFYTFIIFYSEIKNQFNSSIKILRSDDYLNNFSQFLKQNRILHQFLCLHSAEWGS